MTVHIPASQVQDPDRSLPPLSIGSAMLAFMVPVEYSDNRGTVHQEFVFVVGDTVYKDPTGEQWAAKLKTMSDKVAPLIVDKCKSLFADEIRRVLKELGVVPGIISGAKDEVDVLADETDVAVSPAK